MPVGQPGPRQAEHRAHRDLDRASVERVGAPRRQQHRVEPERRPAAEDRADVGVVDEVLEDQDRPGAVEHVGDRRQRSSYQRSQRTPVDVEPGDLLGQRLGDARSRAPRWWRARRPARRASAAPSGTSAPGSRPRPRGGRPSRPRRGTARARPRGSCAAGRRAGRGSRRAGDRRPSRSRPAQPSARSVIGGERVGEGHPDHLADDDDRGRLDLLVRDGRRRACRGWRAPCAGSASSRRSTTATGVPGLRPPVTSASAIVGGVLAPPSSARRCRASARARPSRPATRDARAAGGRRRS